MAIRVGSKVTGQRRAWYDGEPIKGWPFPEYVGEVTKLHRYRGLLLAFVKYPSGRKACETVSKLTEV